jgi:hypothetical protein
MIRKLWSGAIFGWMKDKTVGWSRWMDLWREARSSRIGRLALQHGVLSVK